MLLNNISFHISEDRIDRATYIITTVGMGERIIKERQIEDAQGRISFRCVTDTGVILVFNRTHEKLLTLWIANPKQISAIYDGKAPSWLMAKVQKNKRYAMEQDKKGA